MPFVLESTIAEPRKSTSVGRIALRHTSRIVGLVNAASSMITLW